MSRAAPALANGGSGPSRGNRTGCYSPNSLRSALGGASAMLSACSGGWGLGEFGGTVELEMRPQWLLAGGASGNGQTSSFGLRNYTDVAKRALRRPCGHMRRALPRVSTLP